MMAIFKGWSTFEEYEACLKRGLCEEHVREIGQDECPILKEEFPRKAFHYIRINILYPLLFKKSPKLEKIKKLMEKTPAFSKILFGGDISEAANTIFILDAVIIFTVCQLSQICCIGALFHIKKRNCEDPKIKSLQQVLLVDQLDRTILHYLSPILEKNFIGYDTGIIKASHILTLIFVRNFCTKFNMKTAINNIEKDIEGDESCWENFKLIADHYYKKEKFEEASKGYFSALFQNLYSPELYSRLADCYLKLQNFKVAQLYAYFAISMKPNCSKGYYQFGTALLQQNELEEAVDIIEYALKVCESTEDFYQNLHKLHNEIDKRLDSKESKLNSLKKFDFAIESGEKFPSTRVKLIDSDSAESEQEVEGTKSLSSDPVKEQIEISIINKYLKEASEALLADCGYKAVQIFRGPLRHFMESSELLTFEECDVMCIKYSYAIAYCKSGGYDDLQKCIDLLKTILKDHDSIPFPAAYYYLGQAYRKLNRFKEALHYLEIVQNFLHKGIHFKVYPWPGMTAVIQETKSDVLKVLVRDLIKECENPPNPDAFCRYINCKCQPSIYYSDPDFKGYVSLYCSEQCCMQYHFLCWKEIKLEKNLTDKDFLEKACFTPDCDGVVIKIQNIDKKGNLSKKFNSDFKKLAKQKGAKLEKRSESKEKKHKKINGKYEEMTSGNDKTGNCHADMESVSVQLSGFCVLLEESKSEPLKMGETELSSGLQNNIDSSRKISPHVSSFSTDYEDAKEVKDAKQVQEDGPQSFLNECIKSNVYSFMNDFLQHHGPLKVDDPLLTNEIESFPEEVHAIIAKYGGIGEFLKDDLRFAYVGDMYVCVVGDLASAYKMCNSICLQSLQTLEKDATDNYYIKYNSETLCHTNTNLNPDAVEYTPFSTNNSRNSNKFSANNLLKMQNFNSDSSPFSDTDTDQISGSILNTFSESERYSETRKYYNSSCEKLCSCTKPSQSSGSKISIGDMHIRSHSAVPENSCAIVKSQLLKFLKIYNSEDMKLHRQSIDSYIKPFVIKSQSTVLVTSESMTDAQLAAEDSSKVDMYALFEQNSLINEMMEKAKQNQEQLNAEIVQLKKKIREMEVAKKEFMQKEQEMIDGRKYLLESLTRAHETIDNQKQKLSTLTEEKNNLQKNIDNLAFSLKKYEDKLKSSLEAKEKYFNDIVSSLQNERDELKERAKYAELQVLHFKKTESLNKIDEKSVEATNRRKELTDGLSMISTLNPILQNDMKTLAEKLLAYVNNLNALKVDFMKKVDEELEKVKNGTPLKEIKALEKIEIPEIPCYKNSFSSNDPLPCSFGLHMGAMIFKKTLISPPNDSIIPNTKVNQTFNHHPLPTPDTAMFCGTKVPPSAKEISSLHVIPTTTVAADVPLDAASLLKSNSTTKEKLSNDSLDTVLLVKSEMVQNTWDIEMKKATGAKNSYEKLLNKLKEHFPQHNQDELLYFVKEFRTQRQGKLSGLPMDTIISEISKLIIEKKKIDIKKIIESKGISNKVLVNKKLVSDSRPTSGDSQQQAGGAKKKTCWDTGDSKSKRQFSGSLEDDCSICYEKMTRITAYKVSCGHTFHELCIRNWLDTQSTCPNCRLLVLLPEEYPSLS